MAVWPYLLPVLQAARHGLEGLDDLCLGGGGVVQRLQTDALQQLQEVGDQLHPQGLGHATFKTREHVLWLTGLGYSTSNWVVENSGVFCLLSHMTL